MTEAYTDKDGVLVNSAEFTGMDIKAAMKGIMDKAEKEGFGNCIYPIDADTTQEMLLPAFKHNHHNPELKNKILACSSTENNLRMYSQYSNFTVHNSLERLEDICDENMLYKIIIPSGRKQYFIESLRVFGISESFVYPDLDHISSDLKDSYGI